ncbi:MFS transporter [Niabella ginsenosidivorans]|uniref:MFS transporter n=1 Tax=Niabella ginsenosidivorans TaxID=1176587 RepID=A0A1A9I084_9BACT|nr:MFS transporter [Niabella ginsenosidivorans]ANH80141.1 MFS transporter [Niabella ginsenosidivorans]
MEEEQQPSIQITNDPLAAVRIPEYRNLMTGRFLFVCAMRMITTVVGWWIYQLTRDPLAIGLIGLSEVIPALSLALYSGHKVDISDKKKLLLRSISGYFAAACFLLFLSSGSAKAVFHTRHIEWFIYGTFFCTGILRSFVGPSFTSMIATIVPKKLLQNATTWNQGTWLSASVTGHALGGFLIAFVGISNTLAVIATFILLALLALTQLKPKPPFKGNFEKKTWESVKEGLKFVFSTKALLAAMALDMFAVLFGGAVALIPVFASDILKIGPIGFGWLNAASDIGAIIIVIILTLSPMKKAQGKKMLIAVAGYGVCIILFGSSKWFLLSFFALMISGILDGISVVVRGTVMQLLTPDHMRGRVSSVSGMFVTSSNELGQFESGVMSRLMGVIPSVLFGGCMTIAVVATTWFKAPTLRKFEY